MPTTTKIDLVTQVFNILRPVNGGTGLNDFPNPVGKVGYLFSDGQTLQWRQIMNDTLLQQMIAQLESMRLALIAIACEGGRNLPQDFDVSRVKTDQDGGMQ